MDYLTIKQTAEVLQVSVRVTRILIKNEGLPTVKLGERLVRVPKDLLNEWIEARAKKEETTNE